MDQCEEEVAGGLAREQGEESDSLFGVAEIHIPKWEAEHTEAAKTITALWFCRMGVGMEPDWCQQSHPLDAHA